jgi:transposase
MPKNPTLKSENTEITALRKALEEANMKNRALNTLIDVAEEQLKIDIRKKSGARQSSK